MPSLNQSQPAQRPGNISHFQVGDTVGDYRITEILGAGAAGQVFRVEHTVTRRVEAMKVLIGGRTDQRELAQRFLREIKVQASLNHPGIASVYNAFWVKDDLVMIMELVQGHPLSRILERERLSLPMSLDYVSQALSALHYAHAHGVIHRDISPNNLLVTPAGLVKITDFGLAKTPNEQHITVTGAVLGTVHYMSPEQVRGRPADMRSDLYSLGCLLYELAAGRKPFDGGNAFAIMQAHVEEAPQMPSRLNPAVPRSLDAVLVRALAKRPEDRYQTAEEFRGALELVRREVAGRRQEDREPAKRAPVQQGGSTGAPRPGARISRVGVIVIAAFTCLASFGAYVAVEAIRGRQPAATAPATAPTLPRPAANSSVAGTPDSVDALRGFPETTSEVSKPLPKPAATMPAAGRIDAAKTGKPLSSRVTAVKPAAGAQAAHAIAEPPPVLSQAPAVTVPPPAAAAIQPPDGTFVSPAPTKPPATADEEPVKRKPGRVKRIFGRILGRGRDSDPDR